MMHATDCLFITSSKAGAMQFSVYPYLGVGYLSSFLKKKNLTCALYDVDVKNISINRILKAIATENPLVVGYSIMSISLPLFYRITQAIRKRFPEMITVAGGPHITNDPQIVFDMGIDFGFRGHCEYSFPLFLERLKNNRTDFGDIAGIVIRKDNIIKDPAYFDVSASGELPDYPLYKFLNYQNIFYGRKWFTMITTDGCAYNCKFCKDPGKNRYNEYPLESIKKQLKTLVLDYKLKWISFVDDSFTYNRKRVIDVCNFILEEGLKFNWTCCTRADVLDSELIKIMKQAGLYYVILGVEAGNDEIRKAINKHVPTSKYIEIINEIRQQGVKCLCSYVIGNPGETNLQIRETIRLSLRLNANYAQFYNMTALPQSPIFTYGVNEGVFKENVWSEYMKGETHLPYYVPRGMTLSELKRFRSYAFFRYYIRPKKSFDIIVRLLKFFYDMLFRNQ